MRNQNISIGDKVIVAVDNRATYRPDVKCVTVIDVKVTAKRVQYFLDDGSSVLNEDKMFKIEPTKE